MNTFLVCVGGPSDGCRVDVPHGQIIVMVRDPDGPVVHPAVTVTTYRVNSLAGHLVLVPSWLAVSDVIALLLAGYQMPGGPLPLFRDVPALMLEVEKLADLTDEA